MSEENTNKKKTEKSDIEKKNKEENTTNKEKEKELTPEEKIIDLDSQVIAKKYINLYSKIFKEKTM